MSKTPGANRPAQADDAFLKALALHRQDRVAEAEAAYRAILKSQHRHFDAAHLLGLIFLKRGEAEAAVRQIGRALKCAPVGTTNPNVAEAWNNHGLALTALERFEEALASFDRAIAIRPDHVDALTNRGSALHELRRFDEALVACDRLLAAQPRLAVVHRNRGKILRELHRFEEALSSFDTAIALQPDYHDAFFNRGLIHLVLGDYGRGWADAEHRWQTDEYAEYRDVPQLAHPASRDSVKNRRVLVAAEQGIGDEIMFASMIPDLLRDAQSVALECEPRLHALFGGSFPGVALLRREKPRRWDTAEFDCVIAAGSLGRLYRNTAAEFPAQNAYLTADTQIARKWRQKLSALGGGLKVGISWKGGVAKTRSWARSIPLDRWGPVLQRQDTCFVSLQYGEAGAEIARANRSLPRPIACFERSEIDDFDQLAGLVSSLDLVVTVDTSLVHLCGAIGKSCRVLVPFIPEWRYGVSSDRMPWYGSVMLFRQQEPGIWDETIARVAAGLENPQGPPGVG